MKWTKEKPTKEGWYWVKQHLDDDPMIAPYYFYFVKGEIYVADYCTDFDQFVEYYDGNTWFSDQSISAPEDE